ALFHCVVATAAAERWLYLRSLHDALPISFQTRLDFLNLNFRKLKNIRLLTQKCHNFFLLAMPTDILLSMGYWLIYRLAFLSPDSDRKSTRLNSSHVKISYSVFCLINKIAF